MSLRSMAVMRAEAEDSPGVAVPARGPQRASAPRGGARDDSGQLERSRDQLIALIPAEAVALFILLIGLTAEEAVGWRVGALVGVSLFAIAWTALSYWEAKGGRKGAAWPTFEMVVGVVAFLAWSTSVPASPFAELDLAAFVGPLIVAVVSAVLVYAARLRAIWAKPARQAVGTPTTQRSITRATEETMAGNNEKHYCVVVSQGTQGDNDRAALLNEARWPDGQQIRVRFLEGDESLRERVKAVAERWIGPDMAQLTLEWVEGGESDIRIAFAQGDGSWSYLGTQCQDIPDDQSTMNYGWLTPDSDDDEVQRVVLHEFGHALGLIHEHQNPQGGIDWNEPAVIADLSAPPNEWDEATIRSNVLDHYDPNAVTATDVDSDSIMMYPIPASWTNDGFSADLNSDLSPTDIEFIRSVYAVGDRA